MNWRFEDLPEHIQAQLSAANIAADMTSPPRKYGNEPTVVDGITFDSSKEARRYGVLKILERAGNISDLELQPRFRIHVNGRTICTYIADFAYTKDGARIVEDVKGVKTPVFNLKRKLMKAVHGIDVVTV